MFEATRLTKIQAALLRSAQTASEMIGTRGRIPINLFDRIVVHYFRTDRQLGATRELLRHRCVVPAEDGYYRLVLPPSAHRFDLPGPEPEGLGDMNLIRLIEQSGCSLKKIIPVSELPEIPQRPRRVYRRLILLANHHFAEKWYGDALPSSFSHDVISVDQPETDHSIQLRSQLVREKKIVGLQTPGNRQSLRWQVTASGIQYYEQERTTPTITLDVIRDLARMLGIKPLTPSDPLGR